VAVGAVDALAEDPLVLGRVLPAGELGHGDVVPVGLEDERAPEGGQVRAGLAAVQRVREQRSDRGVGGLGLLELARDHGSGRASIVVSYLARRIGRTNFRMSTATDWPAECTSAVRDRLPT